MRRFFKTTANKILLVVAVFSILIAVLSPIILSSPQCTTEITQAQRDASRCIVGADFGPGFGIIFGIGFAVMALLLAWILGTVWFKKLSFLTKFFLLIPVGMLLLFLLYALFGLVNFILQK